MKKLILLAMLTLPIAAQTPTLSSADKIAIQTLEKTKADASTSWNTAQQSELTVLGEWTKDHPGWHIDPQTFNVLADPKLAAKPESAKAEPVKK